MELSDRYLTGRFLPDKAIDVMDEAGARARITSMTRPPDVKEIEKEIDSIRQQKEAAIKAQDFEKAAALRDTIVAFFEAAMVADQIVLPYAKQGLLGDVYENARVLSEDYDDTGRIMKVRGLPGAIARLRRTLAAS